MISLSPGGSGALAAYVRIGSPPNTTATGVGSPRAAYRRQCRAPSWCTCQCIAARRGPITWMR